jgi:putative ABC transport system permease protein
MFLRILRKSLVRRKSRVALAVLAVILGASVSSALLNTSMSMSEKLSEEFRRFGANIIVLPQSDTIEVGLPGISLGSVTDQRYINESELWKIKRIANWSANVLGYAPFLYQVVEAEFAGVAKELVLAGTYFDHPVPGILNGNGDTWTTGLETIAQYWHVDGSWVKSDGDLNEAMVGVAASRKLGLMLGSELVVRYTNPETKEVRNRTLSVEGIVTTGGPEDSQVFVNLKVAQELSGRPDKVHDVQVSALCMNCPAEKIAMEIQYAMPGVEAKSVRQLVTAENEIMMRLEQMMLLVTIVALGASALGVMTTMSTTVIERRKEIGLMKAIGSDNRPIAGLFLAEAGIVGLIGGLLGYGVGLVISGIIGRSVFDSAVSPVPMVMPLTVLISIGIALLAAALPTRRATSIEPAIVLRGD